MKTDPRAVKTGVYYIDGDVAAGLGALAAGCKFIGGYPITPSTEAAEAFARVAYDGQHWIRCNVGNTLCTIKYPARWTLYRSSHQDRTSRYDAVAVGFTRRL